ncbi:MAG: diaminopimelate epimerase [Alistipes sp.]
MNFVKYEGAGNDFILIDVRQTAYVPSSKIIAELCNRHFGVGADGVMLLGSSTRCQCTMRYFNADGSVGEMCGNGGRCFALFAHHLGIGGAELCFESLDGDHTARLLSSDNCAGVVELGMIDVEHIIAGGSWWSLNTGVPHYVEFTDNAESINLATRGREICHDTARFPQGTNVNFVQITGWGAIRMRTYERGVEAETLACGTGATAAALVTNFVLQPDITHFEVSVPGGMLQISFERNGLKYSNIRLKGDARKVFSGVINIENL